MNCYEAFTLFWIVSAVIVGLECYYAPLIVED